MQCPVCHTEFEGSPRFCNKCGSNIEATRATNAPETEVSTDPFIGKNIGGRYNIVRLLGEGGMGAVYLGEQNVGGTRRKVAIKTLHLHLSNDPKIKQRFERECATVAELQHPNTIQLYDYGTTEEGILYMVMEFVQGESLASILEKKKFLDPARTQHILQQICDALGEAHALGIVHRDLKPDNIVLTERAKDWVKVLDFGIAKRSEAPDKEEAKLTQQGTVLGTPPYMSPEQFTGKPIDARSDIYSIGVISYEMLAGTLPFSAGTPWEWATQHMTVAPKVLTATAGGVPLPPAMSSAITQALAKDPAARFSTTKEFFDAFSSASSSAPSVAAAAAAPGGTAIVPAGFAAEGAIDQKGKTQIGAPLEPSGAYGLPSYGPPPGTAPGTAPGGVPGVVTGGFAGGQFGTPAAGNVAFPVTAIPPGPAPFQEKSGGRGGLIAFLSILGVLSAAAVAVALTRHPAKTSVAGDTPPTAQPIATHADIAPTAAPVDPNPLDTSVAPLNSGSSPPPTVKKADGGAAPSVPTAPTAPPSLATPPGPTLVPTIPTAPANDPRPCKNARALRAKNYGDYKHRLELEKLEERCAAAGGSL